MLRWLKNYLQGYRLPRQRAHASASLEPNEAIVRSLYLAVLRRDPDPGGLATYLNYLNSGHSVLEIVEKLASSAEFRARDNPLSKHLSPRVTEFTRKIRQAQLNRESYDAFVTSSLAELYKVDGRFAASQERYINLHRNRFYEIGCAALFLSDLNPGGASILDFGYSINSHILKDAIANANVSTADRPQMQMRVPKGQFHSSLWVDLTDDRLDNLDWGQRFDLIVFAEVIEHVLVNPIKVIKFLLKHLTPKGSVILTTPNIFSRDRLELIRQRRSPLPPYPLDYMQKDAPHFHIREYSMIDLLEMIERAGGKSQAFFFSPCWDKEFGKHIPADELGNLFIIFGKA